MMKSFVLAVSCSLAALVAPARAEVDPPVPVRTVPPEFPTEMRQKNVSGIVTINCLIDPKGNVQELKVVKSTNLAFEEPAMDALRKWKFKPAQRDGNVIPVRVTIPIKFSINDN
jgi:protein TonB